MKLATIAKTLTATAMTALVIIAPAQAAVTFNWSAGATCGNSSSVGFTPGGAAFQASLCASTTAERGCGYSAVLRASDTTAGQQNNFRVTALARGGNYPDPNTAIMLPVLISNPPTILDFGATAAPSPPTSVPPAANQLLATFTFAAQASATNAQYTINLTPASEFAVDYGVDTCMGAANSGAALPVLTLYLGTPPTNAPGAPTLGSINLSPGSATVNFSPPSNNGGSAIVGYTATCTADGQVTRAAFASASPITVNGLRSGVFYTCGVTATNSGGFTSGSSGSLTVTTTPAADIAALFLLLLD